MRYNLLLLLAIVATALPATARDFDVDGLFYNFNDDGRTVSVTYQELAYPYYHPNYPHLYGSLSIPSNVTYKGKTYSVTSIGGYAFYGCSGLTSVTIPNSVTSIGEKAFYGCSGLTSVTIGNSVTTIGEGAFSGCSGLTSVTIGNSVTTIGARAFSSCSGLTSVTIPNSVTTIGEGAFSYCSGLTSVDIPNSVTTIGISAFSSCSGLTSVTIPNSVTTIGRSAFSSCSGLTSVDIPNSVTTIGGSAFSGCSGLTSVDIPNSVTTIGEGAFSSCSGLTSVTIPNSVTTIGEGAFSYCSGLTSVDIPNSVTTIGIGAFSYCSGLTSVTIGNSVTTIGGSAFFGCSGLTSVDIPNSVTTIGAGAFEGTAWFNNQPNGLVYAGLVAYRYKYKGYMPIGTIIIIKSGTKGIADYAFSVSGCYGLTNVTIPNSVTTIGEGAFSNCSGLTRVTIPNSVTTIGRSAFSSCSGLTRVTIGNSVTSIGEYAFFGCSCLRSVTIGNSVTTIGEYAFKGCSGLKSVTNLATEPQSIDYYIFYDVNLKNCVLYVPQESVERYKSAKMWQNFGKINCILVVDGLQYYVNDDGTTAALVDVNSVDGSGTGVSRDVVIPKTVSSNGKSYTVTSIGNDAFRDCAGMMSVTIPYTVTSIGDFAFYGCTGLRSVKNLAAEPQSITFSTFYDVDISSCKLIVREESASQYRSAPYWKEFIIMEVSAIDEVTVGRQRTIDGYYDMKGVRHAQPVKGVNIVRYTDGTTEKIIHQ